jgi:hypothetical protein
MNRILDILRSPVAMMVALILALTAQGKHTADVFTFFSHPGTPQWLSYAFAAAVEVAVLLFVLNRHKHISYAFAVATFATNMVYYAIGGTALQSVALVPVVLLSALLPGVIVGYSHTIAESAIADAPTPAPQPAKARRYRWQFWRKPTETPTTNTAPSEPLQAPVARPSATLGHSDVTPATEQTGETSVLAPPTELRAVAAKSDSDIAAMLGVKRQAVQGWRKRNTLEKNIAEKLPAIAAPHTNGFNHE